MKNTICNQVRVEIDERELSAPLSVAASEHLKICSECKEFQSKETKLRQIVGSLETVKAPADFDFRLRARLATDRSLASNSVIAPLRLFKSRSFAVAVMLLIFAATVLMVRQVTKQDVVHETNTTASVDKPTPVVAAPATTPATPKEPSHEGTTSGFAINDTTKPVRRPGTSTVANRRPVGSLEFSNTSAPVIRSEQSMATMATFPLDISRQSFTVSLDNGHGASRTISVPTVSFGAGRTLPGTAPVNQFAPKGDW
jgi:hypothetical protein